MLNFFGGAVTAVSGFFSGIITTVNAWWTGLITTFRKKIIQTIQADLTITMAWKGAERILQPQSGKDIMYGIFGIAASPLVGYFVGMIVDAVVPLPSAGSYPLVPSITPLSYSPSPITITPPSEKSAPIGQLSGAPITGFTGIAENDVALVGSSDYSVRTGFDVAAILQGVGEALFTIASFYYAAPNPINVYGANWLAQTFTVGATPYHATYLNLWLGNNGGVCPAPWLLTVSLYATTAGVPSGAPLATVQVTVYPSPTFPVEVPIPSTLLAANTQYAIVFSAPTYTSACCPQVWAQTSGASYSGGSLMSSNNSGFSWNTLSGEDANFTVEGHQ